MGFEIKIPLFEGPFDLLLFFIKRDELDINDIPIAQITQDFLAYIDHLEEMNIEVASEFILVAATLMKIKSQMLLPRPELDEQGEEVDPREELVQHLLAYKRYKSVSQDFEEMEGKMLLHQARGNTTEELKLISKQVSDAEVELQDIDLYQLYKAYRKVLRAFESRPEIIDHQVKPYPYDLQEKRQELLNALVENREIRFVDILAQSENKISLIFSFLAILDLIQFGQVGIRIGEGVNNFWLIRISSPGGL